MKVAFQMEPLSQTNREETHSLRLIAEACQRGYEVFHYEPGTVSLDNDGVYALAARAHVDLSRDDFYTLGPYEKTDLASMDVIHFRQDPPYDIAYVTNTLLIERLKDKGVLVVNDPFWIRNMADKISIFDYPDYLPPTLVSRNLEEIEGFLKTHDDIVLKPLHSFHGHGIVRTSSMKDIEAQVAQYKEPLMFQPFLKEIYDGNKRIVLFDGEIAGSLKSVVQGDEEFRIYRDSIDVAYEPDAREIELCKKMGPVLKERGLIFVGLDFIGPYLTEINVGSVGSIIRLNKIYKTSFEAKLWDIIEAKVK